MSAMLDAPSHQESTLPSRSYIEHFLNFCFEQGCHKLCLFLIVDGRNNRITQMAIDAHLTKWASLLFITLHWFCGLNMLARFMAYIFPFNFYRSIIPMNALSQFYFILSYYLPSIQYAVRWVGVSTQSKANSVAFSPQANYTSVV
jgi:hypothetical protein